MPYIKQKNREILTPLTDMIQDFALHHPGDLNYILTKICHHYISVNETGYQAYNDVIGALEGCKLELYRQHIAKYEDSKITENGDV